ncbi:hypothetical protein SEA_GALADRIEL_62 [Gordonia phage Galadriel]|uniref:Uncharacterized protein n=2 Tax=Vividuovirus TaxID=2560251 RepID=A0A7G8LDZ6_9CAUD|nr:hypothetical protein KNU61_gp62 [Gordonia phage Galadriel]YP_010109519.1 hypothetical protein KNV17_gp65 [Gordonia phage Paries]QDH92081.1 hypothetical protein SEA_GALADRIEL_62 [Gordonia phage Galadriel]QNJ55468.1 hypothetical protein SEA_PARIES_65 [Gordonia phage Paries]
MTACGEWADGHSYARCARPAGHEGHHQPGGIPRPRPTDDDIVAEIDVLAHDAKLGTAHEQHDGWYFELHQPRPHEDRAPHRVLTCGCGVVLVNAPVTTS